MPYSMDKKDELPDYVRELDEDKQAQWVAVYNSAYETCKKDEGEDCESSAFAQANGVVLEDSERAGLFARISHAVTAVVKSLLGFGKQRTPMGMGDIYQQVWSMLDQMYTEGEEYTYLVDVFVDEGAMYAICTKEGKLWRVPLTIDGTDVNMGEWQEVIHEFKPLTRTTIKRTEDGKYRWFSIANSAVLNRVGEIDSRHCIDSFVGYAQESGEYPYRTFYHKGEAFRTGQCDWLARYEDLLLTSGLYDDTPIAQAEIRARQAEPEYWGESIGYDPLGEPEMMEIGGVKIPVYDVGILREISTAPERECAALYTNRTTTMEVNRMLNQREKEALDKLFGDSAKADEWLATVEGAERSIKDSGQITRTEEVAEAAEEQVIEIDDETIELIAQRTAESLPFADLTAAVSKLTETMDALQRQVSANEIKHAERMTALANRLESVERSDDDKRSEWLEDLPERSAVKVSYRPRVNAAGGEKPSMADIASQTLSNLRK